MNHCMMASTTRVTEAVAGREGSRPGVPFAHIQCSAEGPRDPLCEHVARILAERIGGTSAKNFVSISPAACFASLLEKTEEYPCSFADENGIGRNLQTILSREKDKNVSFNIQDVYDVLQE